MEKIKKAFRSGLRHLRNLLPGNVPDFIIVGAQKAGTTSLHYYLKQHPALVGSSPKEVRFFNRDDNYDKGHQWYFKAFRDAKNPFKKGLYFEATPEYLYRSFVPERIHALKPDMKIIILLRDPVKRAYSAWNMFRDFPIKFKTLPGNLSSKEGYKKGTENNILKELYQTPDFPSFENCFEEELLKIQNSSDLEEPSFFRRGIYLPQIQRYHELFGKENVLVLGFRELIEDKQQTLNKVLAFLGLNESNWSFLNDEGKNVRSYPQQMSKEMEERLKSFYEPYNEALFQYLGTKIKW